jgi:hypothetical protein
VCEPSRLAEEAPNLIELLLSSNQISCLDDAICDEWEAAAAQPAESVELERE